MSVTERLEGVGEFTLRLKDETPIAVLNQLDVKRAGVGFGQIIITAVRQLGPLNDSDMLALSRYTGIYRKGAHDLEISGVGLNAYLGDEDGKGPYFTSLAFTNGTFAQWAAALKPSGLGTGIVSTIPGTFTQTYSRTYVREPLEEVGDRFGAEWRVRPNGLFDFGLPSDLFVTTPRATIVRNKADAGRDLNTTGIPGDLEVERDLEDWSRAIRYIYGSGPSVELATGGIADADVPYRAFDGSVIQMNRIVNAGNTVTTGSEASLAAAQFGRFNAVRQEISLTSDVYDIGQDIRVGDYVNAYDPLYGIQDLSNPVGYRGITIYPEVIRVMGYRWPVRRGMGVYLRYYTNPGSSSPWPVSYLDLTDYVEFERGTTSVEVGAKPRGI